jgi:hypothetical protein
MILRQGARFLIDFVEDGGMIAVANRSESKGYRGSTVTHTYVHCN